MGNSIGNIGVALVVGGAFFVIAVMTTFSPTQLAHSRFDPVLVIFVNFLSGLVAVVIGYESMVGFGGRFSLGIAKFVAKVSGSRQVVEVIRDQPMALSHGLISQAYLAYVPPLVFLISIALSWDIFTLDTAHSGPAQPFFHLLDIFARNLRVNPVLFSLELVPIFLLLIFVAGIVPSVVLPYFGRFRVTGVNSTPFHKGFLMTTVAVVTGVSAVFSLSALFYEVLFTTQEPLYYHYSLLQLVGLSLYYGVGSSLGLERAGRIITKTLETSKPSDLVFQGTVALG